MTVTGLKWFKIQEEGYNPSTGKWAVDNLVTNKGKYTFSIPSCIEPGDYLMRHELIGKFPYVVK
jgi:cellulase